MSRRRKPPPGPRPATVLSRTPINRRHATLLQSRPTRAAAGYPQPVDSCPPRSTPPGHRTLRGTRERKTSWAPVPRNPGLDAGLPRRRDRPRDPVLTRPRQDVVGGSPAWGAPSPPPPPYAAVVRSPRPAGGALGFVRPRRSRAYQRSLLIVMNCLPSSDAIQADAHLRVDGGRAGQVLGQAHHAEVPADPDRAGAELGPPLVVDVGDVLELEARAAVGLGRRAGPRSS